VADVIFGSTSNSSPPDLLYGIDDGPIRHCRDNAAFQLGMKGVSIDSSGFKKSFPAWMMFSANTSTA
jgi:hypothetical protein